MLPIPIAAAYTPTAPLPASFLNTTGFGGSLPLSKPSKPKRLVAKPLSEQAFSQPRTCPPIPAPHTPPQNDPLNLPWELIPGTCPVDPNILTNDQLTINVLDPLSLSHDNDGIDDNADSFPPDPTKTQFTPTTKAELIKILRDKYVTADTVESCGDINQLDVRAITDMEGLFKDKPSFNCDISNWDVSHVTHMDEMFAGATAFNRDLSSWVVSQVTGMSGMFAGAAAFNGDISRWDVSSVTNMGGMFTEASSFNGDISSWDVSKVTDMGSMFSKASSFNGDISCWDVGQVTSMSSMFAGAAAFNGDLSSWDVSQVTNTLSLNAAAK